jgi:hypothetical protein
MAQTQTVDVKIKAVLDAGPSIAGLKELKKLQRETIAGSKDWNNAAAAIRDFGDEIENSKSGADDFLGKLEGASGPLGMLGKGIRQAEITFSSFNNILKASVIGLLVAAIGGLVAAFSKSEVAMKKLEPLWIGMEKILGGIFRALEPLLDAFIELAMTALPYITEGIGMFYSGLVALFSFLKNTAVGIGKILKGVFTLDFEAITDGYETLTNGWNVAVDSFKSSMKRYEAGTKELTATEKKNAEERTKAGETEAEKRKKIVDEINAYIAKGVEARGKTQKEELADAKTTYDDLMAKAKKYGIDTAAITKSYNEQVAKINQTFRTKELEEDQKLYDEKAKKLQDSNNLIANQRKADLEQAKVIYGENSVEARKAQDDIFTTQQKALEDEKKLIEGKKQLTDQDRNRLAQIVIDEQNLTTTKEAENQKRLKSDVDTFLKTAEENKKARDTEFADKMKFAGEDFALQQQILDQKLEQDRIYYEKLLAQENLTAEQRKKIQDDQTANAKANAEAQIAIEQKKFDAQLKLLQAIAAALNAAADIAGKNTKTGKSLAVAASLINTYAAIAGQLRAFAGVPIPAYAVVQAVATGLVGFKAVSDIIKTPIPAEGGGGGGTGAAPGTSVPRPRGMATGGLVQGIGGPKSDLIPAMLSNGESVINAQSTSMFRPLLSSINAIGGGKRFADGGLAVGSFSQDQALAQLQNSMNFQQAPIKTYVVASEMSNQQMMDRNIKTRSTL